MTRMASLRKEPPYSTPACTIETLVAILPMGTLSVLNGKVSALNKGVN